MPVQITSPTCQVSEIRSKCGGWAFTAPSFLFRTQYIRHRFIYLPLQSCNWATRFSSHSSALSPLSHTESVFLLCPDLLRQKRHCSGHLNSVPNLFNHPLLLNEIRISHNRRISHKPLIFAIKDSMKRYIKTEYWVCVCAWASRGKSWSWRTVVCRWWAS